MTAPTPDEVAKARTVVGNLASLGNTDALSLAARVLLAALDAAERERDEALRRMRANADEMHESQRWARQAEKERDEARALYRAAIGDEVGNG